MAHKAFTITDKTTFVRVQFGVFGNSRKVTNSLVLKNDAAASKLLKINQTLLESPELDAIRSADGKMRTYLYSKCLPYDMGVMILPYALLEQVDTELNDYQKKVRPELVEAFITAYPDRLKQAEAKVMVLSTEMGIDFNMLWHPEYYPTADELKGAFKFNWQYITFTTPETLKEMGMYEAEQAKAAAKMQQAAEEITLLMRQTLFELIDHLKTALEPNENGKPKRLFSSAITNIQDFLETFSARNITNDSELDALVQSAKLLVHPGLGTDQIKKDEQFKAGLHTSLEALGSQLKELVEVIPGRKFRDE